MMFGPPRRKAAVPRSEFRRSLRRCNIGFVNVRTLRLSRTFDFGQPLDTNEEKLEMLICRMR